MVNITKQCAKLIAFAIKNVSIIIRVVSAAL